MSVLSLDLIKHTYIHTKSCKDSRHMQCNSSVGVELFILFFYACDLVKHILAIVNISCFC